MKKITKICIFLSFLFVLSFFILKSNQPNITYPQFTMQLFYYDDCVVCNDFKEIALPKIRKAFHDNFIIEYYNLDNPNDQQIYNDVIHNLVDFNQEYYMHSPLITINNEFAVVGYQKGEEKELIKETKRALKHEPLGNFYQTGRYIYKGGFYDN